MTSALLPPSFAPCLFSFLLLSLPFSCATGYRAEMIIVRVEKVETALRSRKRLGRATGCNTHIQMQLLSSFGSIRNVAAGL
ncbi:unnamed protein product [Pleuronectes platessa]|uniref:Secreted protein n=1 Tax=Pleuronectes platessa TaxID=8262 RepID=A0A9N7TRJ9_PLEPL|nr:unnamed protein product [Pleuronectes platessa]